MELRPKIARPAWLRAATVTTALTISLGLGIPLVSGCGPGPAPASNWPAGHALVARKDALAQVLTAVARLDGTRISRRARAITQALPDCPVVAAHASGETDLWSTLACLDAHADLAPLEAARGSADMAFVLAANEASPHRTLGTLRVADDGALDASIEFPGDQFAKVRALGVQGGEAVGPTLLEHEDELIHARVRPEGGLDIASLVPASSQGDSLFRLKSELFAGAVLDGTWEIAVYLPEADHPMPRLALAVGFSLRDAAIAAMEQFISDLSATWPVRRSGFSIGEADGACLRDLKVMPDLEPCYVATDEALVVGWNPASLRQALAETAPESLAPHPAQGISVDLSRFPDADERLAGPAAQAAFVAEVAHTHWPWQRLHAESERVGDNVRVRVQLSGTPDTYGTPTAYETPDAHGTPDA